jgi:hypothetical protein
MNHNFLYCGNVDLQTIHDNNDGPHSLKFNVPAHTTLKSCSLMLRYDDLQLTIWDYAGRILRLL